MEQFHLMGDAQHEGRMAFRKHGVSGETRHSYDRGSVLRTAFVTGFSDERHRAAERALAEAQAYQALTVREAPRDRAWAERLAAERGLQ